MRHTPLALAARALLAPALVVSVALLVKGHEHTGGGFAAGMVAGLGTLLQYVALGRHELTRRLAWTAQAWRVALSGLALMAATTLLPALAGLPPAWHWPRPGAVVTELGPMSLHTTLLFELGVALTTFGFVVAVIHCLAEARTEQRS